MRPLIFILSFLIANSCYGNSVDSIKSDNDVLSFFKRIDKRFTNEKYDELQIFTSSILRQKLSCDSILEKWDISNWEKADFNNDGKTDLIATVYWYDFEVLLAIDKGNNTFQLIQLSKDVFQSCELGKPLKLNGEQLLLFYRYRNEYPDPEKNRFDFQLKSRIDTLTYKFGGFVEKMTSPAIFQIKEIEFYTSSGWNGISSVSKLKFNSNEDAFYEADSTNPKHIIPKKLVSKDRAEKITELLQYINIKELRNKYLVAWTDATTMYLKITFGDGSIKQIEDYGMAGTFGLSLLYELFRQ